MSTDNLALVMKHSPYGGTLFVVHIMLADLANDAHDNEIWVGTAALAKRARCSPSGLRQHLLRLVADGELEVVEDHSAEKKASRYRLLVGKYVPSERRQDLATDGGPSPEFSDASLEISDVTRSNSKDFSNEKSSRARATKTTAKKPAASKKAKAHGPHFEAATELVTAWWEWFKANNNDAIPTTRPWPAIVGDIEKLFACGFTAPEIKRALRGSPNFAASWLETFIRKERATKHQPPAVFSHVGKPPPASKPIPTEPDYGDDPEPVMPANYADLSEAEQDAYDVAHYDWTQRHPEWFTPYVGQP